MKFFQSSLDWIDMQELTDILCKSKSMNRKLVVQFMKDIDADKSNTVSYNEFFQAFIENLQFESEITVEDIVNKLKDDFPKFSGEYNEDDKNIDKKDDNYNPSI